MQINRMRPIWVRMASHFRLFEGLQLCVPAEALWLFIICALRVRDIDLAVETVVLYVEGS